MRIVAEHVTVEAPATIAHLGPAYDCLACAVTLRDRFLVRPIAGASRLTVHGQSMDESCAVESTTFVKALRAGLEFVGAPQVGVDLYAHHRISEYGGLGRDAAHTVAALLAVRALINEPEALSDDDVLILATEIDGRAPQIASTLYGGCQLAWHDDERIRVTACAVSDGLPFTILIPPGRHRISQRRLHQVLPDKITHRDAVFSMARMGLLLHALAGEGELLFHATEDRLHQEYQRALLPGSTAVMDVLRDRGYPAVIASGGPSVLVLASLDEQSHRELHDAGWKVLNLAVERQGSVLL
ncbi:homoserine kinase [Actinomyces vulturis]|uniref:homoserine kinase n=1 Tax=Actinomyces vulturis TaxID=1857645 RepID=UPI00083334E1|nr:hypothetical protein [Actinomyces vulturis]